MSFTVSIKHAFVRSVTDGGNPNSFFQLNDCIYGTCMYGGASDRGILYKYNINTNEYSVLYSFTYFPDVIVYCNNYIYGTGNNGSSASYAFKIGLDGTGYTLIQTFSFGTSNLTASNNIIYGAISSDGDNASGYIFKIESDTLTSLYSFTGSEGTQTYGSLFVVDGFLYGSTDMGGSLGVGVLYSLNLSNNNFTVLSNFEMTNPQEVQPSYPEEMIYNDNYIYGIMQSGGGAGNFGVIYKHNLTSNLTTVIYTMDVYYPNSIIVSQNLLYIIGYDQGSQYNIFTLNLDGTGYQELFNSSTLPEDCGPIYLLPYSNDFFGLDEGTPSLFRLVSASSPTTNRTIENPTSIAINQTGIPFIFASNKLTKIFNNDRICYVSGSTAGYQNSSIPENVKFNTVGRIVVDKEENIFSVDINNHVVRKTFPNGKTITIAGQYGVSGFQNGQGTQSLFYYPSDLALDENNNIYVTDHNNTRIRKITPDGYTSTLSGSVAGSVNNLIDGNGLAATFAAPFKIYYLNGYLYVLDQFFIRKVSLDGYTRTIYRYLPKGVSDNNPYQETTIFNSFEMEGLAVNKNGDIYFTRNNFEGSITKVVKINQFRGTESIILKTNAIISDIKFDRNDNLLLTDLTNSSIIKILPHGQAIGLLAKEDPNVIQRLLPLD